MVTRRSVLIAAFSRVGAAGISREYPHQNRDRRRPAFTAFPGAAGNFSRGSYCHTLTGQVT